MDKNFEEYFVQEKSSMDKFLDFLVFIAVFIVTIFLLLEIFGESGKISIDMVKLGEIYLYVNVVVFLVFLADLIRLWYESDGAGDFFRNNWLDVLATIPFGLLAQGLGPTFEILKLAKLAKLTTVSKISKVSRVSKIGKEFKAASHLKKEGAEYNKKHRI